MEYRTLGKSGLKVSIVGLGCNNFGRACDAAQTKAIVGKALDLGVTLFDTADMYGGTKSEEFLGRALGAQRKNVIVATKFGWDLGDGRSGASRRYVMRAVEDSLRRLGTDYIDLYQLHTPDPNTPIEETLRALDDLIRAGKVRYVGNSNFAGWQIADAAWAAAVDRLSPFISAQNRYSVLTRDIEVEVVPVATKHGLGILPFFPLESGLLSGKYRPGAAPAEGTRWASWGGANSSMTERFFSQAKFSQVDRLTKLAADHGQSILALAFSWLLAKAYVPSVIAGATKPEQVEGNVKAAAWKMDGAALAAIDAISPPPKAPA
jgi:aryl-alcohol dehydrogenase-like predicted oxidoreductase